MRTKNYQSGSFNHLGDDYYNKLSELSAQCSNADCFIFNNRIFAGNYTQTIKQYLLESPSKSFYVWLIDNKLELTQDN